MVLHKISHENLAADVLAAIKNHHKLNLCPICKNQLIAEQSCGNCQVVWRLVDFTWQNIKREKIVGGGYLLKLYAYDNHNKNILLDWALKEATSGDYEFDRQDPEARQKANISFL